MSAGCDVGDTDVWMPLYIGSYMADTGRLSTEQHGAYMLLIMDYWRKGPPPDDDEVLASITKLPALRWLKHRPIIANFFKLTGGEWRHKRIEEEIANALQTHSARSGAGKAGALARWGQSHSGANGKGNSNVIQNDAPSPSPKEKAKEAGPPAGGSTEFWNFGVTVLTDQGLKEGTARSFLGSLLRDYETAEVESALRSAVGKTEVKSYVLGVLKGKPKKGQPERFPI